MNEFMLLHIRVMVSNSYEVLTLYSFLLWSKGKLNFVVCFCTKWENMKALSRLLCKTL